jgi:hypothetical protein
MSFENWTEEKKSGKTKGIESPSQARAAWGMGIQGGSMVPPMGRPLLKRP